MARDEQFRLDLMRVLETEAGIRVFRQLVKDFNFPGSSITLSTTGEVNPLAVINNEAIRTFWVKLRQLIPYEKLILIEYDPPDTFEDSKCQMTETQQQAQTQAAIPLHKMQARKQAARDNQTPG